MYSILISSTRSVSVERSWTRYTTMFTAELEISIVSCLIPWAVWASLEVLFWLGTHTSNLIWYPNLSDSPKIRFLGL